MNLKELDPYGEENWSDELQKEPDYKGICLHMEEWEKKGIPHSLSDMIYLANKYNIPIPSKKVIRYI